MADGWLRFIDLAPGCENNIKEKEVGARFKKMHGIFFEEISHGGEGDYPDKILSQVINTCTTDHICCYYLYVHAVDIPSQKVSLQKRWFRKVKERSM